CLSHLLSHACGVVPDLPSFPTRRSSDLVVNGQLVTVPATLGSGVGKVSVFVVVHLDTAIVVFVFEFHQTSFFPGLDPLRTFSVFQRRSTGAFRIHGVHQVQTSHGTYGRSSQVQHGNKHQRPASRPTGVSNFRYGEETDDYVRQTSGTDHQ